MRLIDANKVLKHLCEYCASGCYDHCESRCIEFVNISNLPTIEAEPVKHGRWVDNGIPESILSGCSVCGFSCGAYTFNYCPNCGAKMDLEDGNDES